MGFFTKDEHAGLSSALQLAPLTNEAIAAVLDSWEAGYGVDGDGDLGGYWDGHLFYFFRHGEEGDTLHVRARWNRTVDAAEIGRATAVVNEWNSTKMWPKGYARVESRDDVEQVGVYGELSVPLPHGVTHEQLDTILGCAVGTSLHMFGALDEQFPEAAAAAEAALAAAEAAQADAAED